MAAGERLRIEVAYARPDVQVCVPVEVKPGTTAAEAVRLSGLAERFSEIDPDRAALGVYGQHVDPRAAVRDGDRVEIYRPLRRDPKRARHEAAARGGTLDTPE